MVACRFVAILMSSILKAKGVPVRIRSGFAGYFDVARNNMENIENNWEQLLIFWQNPEFRLVRGGLI